MKTKLLWIKSFLKLFFPAVLLLLNACSSDSPLLPNLPRSPSTLSTPLMSSTRLPTDTTMVESTYTPEPPRFPYKPEAEFGVEVTNLGVDFAKIKEMGANWLRYNAVIWSDLEPNEGELDWQKLASLDESLKIASASGLKVILIIRSTPGWAQNKDGYYCGQIKTEKFAAFSEFMAQLATRYSPAPYNVHSWELWNEPDVDFALVGGGSQFGCWGDQTDAFYGGEYYAEMLKSTVPKIKAVDPEAKILSGGLLLDCDPTEPGTPGRCRTGYELPARFFEGILKAGGRDSIDFLSFHGYPLYDPNVYSPILSEINMPSWQARGGVVAGKANFLRETMAKYNTNISLFLTETSLLCPEKLAQCSPVGPEFLQKQAEYGSWLVVRNYAEQINTIWYTFNGPGWRNSAILDQNQNPRPVYQSIQTALRKINGSSITRKIDQYSGISGYEFQSPNGKFLFLAPTADQPPQWAVPDTAVQALDIFGQPVALDSLSPLTAPVFIELR
jgi:hypothetical protein